jgi:hypothetical protein
MNILYAYISFILKEAREQKRKRKVPVVHHICKKNAYCTMY